MMSWGFNAGWGWRLKSWWRYDFQGVTGSPRVIELKFGLRVTSFFIYFFPSFDFGLFYDGFDFVSFVFKYLGVNASSSFSLRKWMGNWGTCWPGQEDLMYGCVKLTINLSGNEWYVDDVTNKVLYSQGCNGCDANLNKISWRMSTKTDIGTSSFTCNCLVGENAP